MIRRLFKKNITLIIVVAVLIFLSISSVKASSSTITFRAKIVDKTSNVTLTTGSPSCFVSGASNDTCDYRASIYTDSSGGTLLWREPHSNVEVQNFNGVIQLNLNSICTSWTAPGGSCTGSGFSWGADPTVFIEIEMDVDGDGDFATGGADVLETFSRAEISSTAISQYSIDTALLEGRSSSGYVQLVPGSAQTTGNVTTSLIHLNDTSGSNSNLFEFETGGVDRAILTSDGQLQLPPSGSTYGVRLGGDVDFYRSAANQLTIPETVVLGSNLYTGVDNTYDIASASQRLNEIYLSGSVRIFSTAGTSGAGANYTLGEISFGGGFSPDSSGNIGVSLNKYWRLDEGSGQEYLNTNSGFYEGTLGPDNTVTTEDPAWDVAANCKIATCLDFDGVDNYAISTGSSWTEFSAAMWVNADDVTNRGIAGMAESFSNPTHDRTFYLDSSAQFNASIYDGVGVNATSTTVASTGTWYHIAMTASTTDSELKLYINGSLEDTEVMGTLFTGYTTPFYVLGFSQEVGVTDEYFDGNIDEIGIWDRALTSTEVSDLYNGGAGNTCTEACAFPSSQGTFSIATGNVGSATDGQINIISGLPIGNTTTSALNLLSSVNLGATDELLQVGDSGGTFLTVLGNGNVGIGTVSPQRLLHLTPGTTEAGLRLLTTSTPGSPAAGDIYSDGTDLFYYNGSTWDDLTDPGSTGDIFTDGGSITYLTSTTDSVALGGSTSSSPFYFDEGAERLTLTNTTSGYSFRVNDDSSDSSPFIIDASGNVYIKAGNFVYDGVGSLSRDIANYLKLDDSTGQTVTNSVSTGTDGFLGYDGTGADDATWIGSPNCKIGSCLDFAGANVSVTPSVNGTEFTAAMWINADDVTERGIAGMAEDYTSGVRDRDLFLDSSGNFNARIYDGGAPTAISTTVAVADTWYHIAMTASTVDSELKIYINGVLEDTEAMGGLYNGYTAPDYTIGYDNESLANQYFDGQIDEVGVWDRALSADEIKSLYNGGKGNTCFSDCDTVYTPSGGALTVNGDIGPGSNPTEAATAQVNTLVATTGVVGYGSSVAIASDGLPIITYYDDTNDDLLVVKCLNASCSSSATPVVLDSDIGTDTFGVATGNAQRSKIIIGRDGNPVIDYFDGSADDLGVVFCSNYDCSTPANNIAFSIISTNSVGQWATAAIGSDGMPIFAFNDLTATDFTTIKCNYDATVSYCNQGFTTSDVDTSIGAGALGTTGYSPSIAIQYDGYPITAYHDTTANDLIISKCNSLACNSNATSTLASTGDIGEFSAMTVGADGLAFITYLDDDNNDLIAAKCGNLTCALSGATITVIDSSVGTNFYSGQASVGLGVDGFPIVAYVDTDGTNEVNVIKCGNAACSTGNVSTTVYSTSDVTQDVSLIVPPDGLPVITAFDAVGSDLLVIKCGNISCSQTNGGANSGFNVGSTTKYFNNVYANKYWGREFAISNFDVAEEYLVEDESIEAGDVVRLKKETEDSLVVEKTDRKYDEGVVGVISTEPGLYLRSWEENTRSRPVALSGRVPVKVSTENGNIQRGDYLTASSTPGYAMKATEGGYIVGRAMEDFPISQGDSQLVKETLEAQVTSTEETLNELQSDGTLEESEVNELTTLIDESIKLDVTLDDALTYEHGRIMMYVDLSYVEDLNYTGGLNIKDLKFNNGGNLFELLEGGIKIKTNLTIEGSIEAKEYRGMSGEDLLLRINEGRGIRIIDSVGNDVFSINERGKITIKTSEGSSVGNILIPVDVTEYFIENTSVTSNSRIQISLNDKNVDFAVTEKLEGEGFRVQFSEPINIETQLNYLIIN